MSPAAVPRTDQEHHRVSRRLDEASSVAGQSALLWTATSSAQASTQVLIEVSQVSLNYLKLLMRDVRTAVEPPDYGDRWPDAP